MSLATALDTVTKAQEAISDRKIDYSRYGGRIQAYEYAKCMGTLKARYDAAMKASKRSSPEAT